MVAAPTHPRETLRPLRRRTILTHIPSSRPSSNLETNSSPNANAQTHEINWYLSVKNRLEELESQSWCDEDGSQLR
ncbi:hypothetical protein M413DRAFT_442299 [Hebeloma cylindrosporum]|uniref:Uncharacterized protein n=1 Tax=Hebeloma cylindrosporum TaxID=76867 RepID=A0A0C2Y751_HEBCY|nr:hypothetical protein M413DRAFT_442299 [Hebeloma cylindrosporum h7]